MIAAIIIAWAHPATGYELDIYKSTPIFTWIFLVLAISGGAYIIFHQIITKGYETSRTWLLGLLVLVLSRFALLYIPYIRGYVSWNGDNIAYLGFIKDILQHGHFSSSDIYPITPVLLTQVISITGITDGIAANLSTALISVIFVLSIYLLVGAVTHDKRQQLLSVVIAGSVFLAGGYNVILCPNGWSILFMPLLFYFLFSQSTGAYRRSYRILLIILLVVYPFFHPLSSLMVIVAFCIIVLTCSLFMRLSKQKLNIFSLSPKSLASYIMIELILFTTWILAHSQFNLNIQLFGQQISSGVGSGELGNLGESLNKINVHGMAFIVLLFKMYGGEIILVILSIAGILWFLTHIRHRNDNKVLNPLPLAFVFLVFGLFFAGYLLGLPGMASLGEGQWNRRFLGYVDILIPLFGAYALYLLIVKVKRHRLVYASTFCLVVMSSILSITTLYVSPFSMQPNNQITHQDMTGMLWLINEKPINTDSTIGCAFVANPPAWFAKGILGLDETAERIDLSNAVQFADHFGYDGNNTIGEQYSQDLYAAIIEADRIVYVTVWEAVGRFLDHDYIMLDADKTVNRLYDNGETTVYYVSAIR
jgi:hypothetical protein